MVPLGPLRDLLTHEQKLLAGVAPHEAVIGPEVGKLLPPGPRHLADHRAFAMHDLVMADRQNEVFGEGIVQTKGHLVVMVGTVDRVFADVFERIVHPAHVPLEAEPQTARIDRGRDAGIGRAFLGHRHDARVVAIGRGVHPAKHVDGFVILAPAVLVRHPFALRARVIAVEHRGDRIHAQPVGVVFLQPIQGVGDQVVRHLAPPIVVDERVPVVVKPLFRVGMFVKRRAVEATQPVCVGREMARHPVEQNADPRPVRGVHQIAKFVREAAADRRCEKPDGLITP